MLHCAPDDARMEPPMLNETAILPHLQAVRPEPAQARDDALRRQAVQLESLLFVELLRASGTGMPSPAGGGETQFESFLRQAQAEAVAGSGQTGLAEAIFRSLRRESNDPSASSAEAAAGT